MAEEQHKNGQDHGPSPEIRQALDKLYALEDEATEKHRLVLGLQDEVNDLRRQITTLTDQLSELRRSHNPSSRRDAELEAQLRAKRNEMRRKSERREHLGEEMQAARRLADNCREFLESGGASIESLEAGVPVPAKRSLGPTTQTRRQEGEQALKDTFGNAGWY